LHNTFFKFNEDIYSLRFQSQKNKWKTDFLNLHGKVLKHEVMLYWQALLRQVKKISVEIDTLHLPLEQLAELSMHNLLYFKTLQRAVASSLYREKWETAGVNVEEIKSYRDFAQLPYTTSREVRRAIYESPIDGVLCSKPIHWFSTTGTTGLSKWLPYGQRDIELYMQIRDRMFAMLPTAGVNLRMLTVTAPAPYVEDGLAILNTIQGINSKNSLSGVTISLTKTDEVEIFNFAFDTKPNVMLSFPSLAARLAEIIAESAPEAAKKQFSKQKTAYNLLVYLITRIKKIHPKDLSKFKFGLFGGEPLEPYREILRKVYGLEPYEMYVFTEFMPPSVECCVHNGMHIWLDVCLPEIIPESELEKEKADGAYVPKAIPVWEAKKGQRGEYVLTTFGEALPLIRYRFGDLIEVTGTEPCGCGYTHPRIKVPRRSDISTVSLGAIRFPILQLEEKVLSATAFGQAKSWQLQLSREDYRPKLIIRLEPDVEITDSASFAKEIALRVLEVEAIKTGVENKLLAQIEVKVESFPKKGKQATKAGNVIYEGE
jgi:phenylacetate-coenzyme A ligase PaaK-like adenylate-forming protein